MFRTYKVAYNNMSILHVNYWNWQTILNLCKKSYKGVQLSKTYPLLKKSSLLSKKVWKCVKFLCKRIDNGKTSNINFFTKNLIIKSWISNPKQLTPIRISNSNKSKNFLSINYKESRPVHCKFDTNFEWWTFYELLIVSINLALFCWLILFVNLFF